MNTRRLLLPLAAGIAAFATLTPTTAQTPAAKVSYQKQIVPILKKNCYSCHNTKSPAEGLDLMTEKGIRKGGEHGKIVVPKKSGESRLMGFLNKSEGYKQMPPGKKLKKEEIELIKKWIDEGLEFDKKTD